MGMRDSNQLRRYLRARARLRAKLRDIERRLARIPNRVRR